MSIIMKKNQSAATILAYCEAACNTPSIIWAENLGYFPKVVGRSMSNDILLSKETLFFW